MEKVGMGEKISTFKERFRELCDSNPTTDTALAEELGVSKQTISSWKNGHRSPKQPMVASIARFFRVRTAWLMGYDVPKQPEKGQFAVIRKGKIKSPVHARLKSPVKQRLANGMVRATVDIPDFSNADFTKGVVYGMETTSKVPVYVNDDNTVRMLKMVGRIAKEDPGSAVEMLKIMVDKDLI